MLWVTFLRGFVGISSALNQRSPEGYSSRRFREELKEQSVRAGHGLGLWVSAALCIRDYRKFFRLDTFQEELNEQSVSAGHGLGSCVSAALCIRDRRKIFRLDALERSTERAIGLGLGLGLLVTASALGLP